MTSGCKDIGNRQSEFVAKKIISLYKDMQRNGNSLLNYLT